MSDNFRAPVIREPKDSPSDHGTRVEVSRLTSFASWLTRPTNKAGCETCSARSIRISSPSRTSTSLSTRSRWEGPKHCVWNASRTVTRDGDATPAVIKINKKLGERAACRVCGAWQHVDNKECEECESRELEVRDRRVQGWVGIARNLDSRQYGIDFLRNGRKILRFDRRSLFQWRDPDDPGGEGEISIRSKRPLTTAGSLARSTSTTFRCRNTKERL